VRAVAWRPGERVDEGLLGAVVAHNVRTADARRFLMKKGEILDEDGLQRLGDAPGEVHLLVPDPGDLHEDEAGHRLALAVAGPGVRLKGLIGAQYQLAAGQRGLLRVDPDALRRINSVEGMTVFTRFDYQPVEQGDFIAAAKCTPLLIAAAAVEEVESIAAASPPIRVLPYVPGTVGVLVLERIEPAARERFAEALRSKLGYFGSRLGSLVEVAQSEQEIVAALRRLLAGGHDVIMLAGASSLDPLEPLFPSLRAVGARIVKHGAPAHPGSLFWLAYADLTPLFGLSSCEMFSQKTVLDLILPRVFAGEAVTREQIVELGYGGLLEAGMNWRFPRYGD
jgi:hypothetical protein